MGVERPLRMSHPVERSLVEAHGIRKGNFEQVVVSSCNPLQDLRQRGHLGGCHFSQAGQPGTMRAHEDLERPDRPKWDQGSEMIIGSYDALIVLVFFGDVASQ